MVKELSVKGHLENIVTEILRKAFHLSSFPGEKVHVSTIKFSRTEPIFSKYPWETMGFIYVEGEKVPEVFYTNRNSNVISAIKEHFKALSCYKENEKSIKKEVESVDRINIPYGVNC
ncbi:MAG: hypothetical protein JSW73_03375 [Candidatus Woesearchaeota archaeon]|nr:MAG: hypothetical protein JSW73_03375 [Candidatus Woesearchaeota archaeon]